MAIEEPEYTVIEQTGAFELRTYSPMIVAETQISGSLDEAFNAGFKVIADYIFGNNLSSTGQNEKVSMTAPVAIAPITLAPSAPEVSQSEKISMTPPVSMKQTVEKWQMHFVMPKEYTLASLPKPNNPAVSLREVPTRQYAVIRFSGFTSKAKIAPKITELMTWVNSKGIIPISEPEIARYNSPWTLPFLRRNEIMVAY